MAWRKAKDKALTILRQRAKRSDPITYSELASKISAVQMEPHDPRLAHFLGEISTDEHEGGRPLITALVVHKHDLQPGKGFFDFHDRLDIPLLMRSNSGVNSSTGCAHNGSEVVT
ncbi:hypothetical protein ACC806_07780 [Rhizobium ruizarguesonis]